MIKFSGKTSDVAINEKKSFVLNSYEEDIAQRINFKINLDKGDWFLDKNMGIPWTSKIFKVKNKKEQEQLIKTYLKKEIEADKDFKEWIKLNINIDEIKRSLSIDWEIIAKNGISYRGLEEIEVKRHELWSY